MKRVGVRPDATMGRAVYLRDIEEWALKESVVELENNVTMNGGQSRCAKTFCRLLSESEAGEDAVPRGSGG